MLFVRGTLESEKEMCDTEKGYKYVIDQDKKRFKVLEFLYVETKGHKDTAISTSDICNNTGACSEELLHILEYLQNQSLIKPLGSLYAMLGGLAFITITHQGVCEVEAAIKRPHESTNNFPAMIYSLSLNVDNIASMSNTQNNVFHSANIALNVNNVQGDNNLTAQGENNQAVFGDNNQVGVDTGESHTKEDIVKLLAQLKTLIQGAELPADTKEEVIEDLSAAKRATEKEVPNKQRALDRLTSVTETLEKTSKTVESGQKLLTEAKPIIVKVAGWLKAAADGSSLLGL